MKFLIVVSVLILRSFYKPAWVGEFRNGIIDVFMPVLENFVRSGLSARLKLALLLFPITFTVLYFEVKLFEGFGLLIYFPVAMALLWLALSEKRVISHLEEYLGILRSNTPAEIDTLAEKLEIQAEDQEDFHNKLMDFSYSAALTYLFNNLFWFATCGITGLVIYQLVRIGQSRLCGIDNEFDDVMALMYFVLEWPVARLLSMSFAFLGNFTAVSEPLINYFFDNSVTGIEIVRTCGNEAIRSEMASDPENMPPKMAAIETVQSLVNLLRRSMITWAAFMGVFAIVIS